MRRILRRRKDIAEVEFQAMNCAPRQSIRPRARREWATTNLGRGMDMLKSAKSTLLSFYSANSARICEANVRHRANQTRRITASIF
jgi:hypothetical protein